MLIRKKVLFVSARLPFPAIEGHQIRAFGILKQLSNNFDIHLFSLLREGEFVDNSNSLGVICKSIKGIQVELGGFSAIRAGMSALIHNKPLVVTKYVTEKLRKNFQLQIEEIKPDIIHLDLLPLAGLIDLIPKGVKVVLNEHNLESDLIRQKLKILDSFFLKLVYQREYKVLSRFEKKVCQDVDLVLACSERDAESLSKIGAKKVCCIPNGVDAKRLQPDNSNKLENTLVFLGGMGWYPNRLGIIWFLDSVFPLILKKNPKIKLQIIGNPEPLIIIPDTVNSNVERLGFVDDFVPYVQKATLMIVPLNVGSGTRLKVVEGLALGKCMVSTSKGAEGVGLTHGEDILFADTPEEFSAEVLEAVNSKEKVSLIEKNARKLADNVYDWDVIGEELFVIYKELV
ncbi:MAG: glycosyltransferase [Oleispira sp.]|nr:glycosyltransferase [Oleispira sp.]MBL4880071.1 glycosyltransferase [Oleispira sp.]